ncbi:MAG: GNAT family N-acetyltransferase [Dokdonella sp.]
MSLVACNESLRPSSSPLILSLLARKIAACGLDGLRLSGFSPQIPGKIDVLIRPIREMDLESWRPLWNGYNAFYGRHGDKALSPDITQSTWRRFLDPTEPVFALVAECDGGLVGLTHYLFHRSTTKIECVCYLQDLFTDPAVRGQGIGRRLIESVYEQAKLAGAKRVYWQTQVTNDAGRALYDKVATHSGFIVYSHEEQ